MLVRLRDFAEINRVSERTVQLHVKENWEKLQDHVDRRGKQGTWLDDYAQEFLLNAIQLPSKDEVLVPTPREAALLIQLAEAHKALAEAERRASLNAEAAGKTALLEAANESQAAQIAELAAGKGQAEEKARQAIKEAEESRKRLEEQVKAREEAEKSAEWAKKSADDLVAQLDEEFEKRMAAEAELEELARMGRFKRFFWNGRK